MLLLREIEDRDPSKAYGPFTEANKIVSRQMRERRHAYYPFRVATHYLEFWKTLAIKWNTEKRSVFLEACQAVDQSLQKVDPDLESMDDINRCRVAIATVLREASSSPPR
jgi:hypothetical protein